MARLYPIEHALTDARRLRRRGDLQAARGILDDTWDRRLDGDRVKLAWKRAKLHAELGDSPLAALAPALDLPNLLVGRERHLVALLTWEQDRHGYRSAYLLPAWEQLAEARHARGSSVGRCDAWLQAAWVQLVRGDHDGLATSLARLDAQLPSTSNDTDHLRLRHACWFTDVAVDEPFDRVLRTVDEPSETLVVAMVEAAHHGGLPLPWPERDAGTPFGRSLLAGFRDGAWEEATGLAVAEGPEWQAAVGWARERTDPTANSWRPDAERMGVAIGSPRR